MRHDDNVLFGIGLEAGVHQVNEMLDHARFADNAGLDVVTVGDHPYFAERVDAYAALGFVLGATSNITGAAAAFIYLVPPGDSISETTLQRWAHDVVPAVREATAKR